MDWTDEINPATIPDAVLLTERAKRNQAKRKVRSGGGVWRRHNPDLKQCKCAKCNKTRAIKTSNKSNMNFKVTTVFGGKTISEHNTAPEAMRSARDHSHTEPVQVWTTEGGASGQGRPIAHFNDGEMNNLMGS